MNGGPQLARKKEKKEPEEEESWEEEVDDEEIPEKGSRTSKLIISILIIVALITLTTASIILISLQEKDSPVDKDTKAPSISMVEPTAGSIIYRGENITVIVDIGENDEEIPTVRGRLSSIDHTVNFPMKAFNYTGNNQWSGTIDIPDDLDIGEWVIRAEALDLAGNEGTIDVTIEVR
jgi:hypothetical protein